MSVETLAARPAVSIIIPTYNHAHFLREALASVRVQSVRDWEAIVINNWSEDNTVDVVNGFADGRIRLVNFHNQGIIAASRNEGIRAARADVLAFMDSDDTWNPRKLERCLDRLDASCDLVCHAEAWVGANGYHRDVRYGPARRAAYRSMLFDGNCLSTSAVVARKFAISGAGGFSEARALVTAEDYDLWLRLAARGARFAFLDEVLGEYRLHGGNQSGAVGRNLNAVLAVLECHARTLEPMGPADRLRLQRSRARAYYGAGRSLQISGKRSSAAAYFLRALLRFPLQIKAYAALLLCLWPARSAPVQKQKGA